MREERERGDGKEWEGRVVDSCMVGMACVASYGALRVRGYSTGKCNCWMGSESCCLWKALDETGQWPGSVFGSERASMAYLIPRVVILMHIWFWFWLGEMGMEFIA